MTNSYLQRPIEENKCVSIVQRAQKLGEEGIGGVIQTCIISNFPTS